MVSIVTRRRPCSPDKARPIIIKDGRRLVDFWTQSAQGETVGGSRPHEVATRRDNIADIINGCLCGANQCIGQRLGVLQSVATNQVL